jgi:benzoyl-CoA reductase/2-hydroxyglutaryl-CoA dehydratase subunit BcrC/BadD/HgdB
MASKEYKEKLINEQMEEIRKLIEEKTDKEFQYAWNESMKEFVKVLNHEKRNPIEYFLLPLNIPGVTD